MVSFVPPKEGAHRQMRYMSRFSCIGPECETTCCHGWTIFLSRPEYKALKKTLSGTEEGSQTFRRNVTRFEGTPTVRPSNNLFAIVQMDSETHDCHFLGEDRWCTLHADHGEEALGNICALFPRMQASFGARTELAGSIGCPETARLALLAEDGCELTETAEPMVFTRDYLLGAIPESETRPYFLHLDTVRGVFNHLLHDTGHPLAVRWLSMALLGQRTSPAFHQGCAEPGATESLALHGEAALEPGAMDEAQRFLDGVDISDNVSARLLVLFLSAVATGTAFEKFRELARSVMNGYLARSGQAILAEDDAELSIQPGPAFAAYQESQAWQDHVLGDHIETVLTRFSNYYLFSQWHTKAPNLLMYVQRMLIEITLFRFLVAGHPDLLAQVDTVRGPDGGLPDALTDTQTADLQSTWDAVMIETWHLLARSLEHAPATIADLETTLAKQGLQSLGLVVHLLKI